MVACVTVLNRAIATLPQAQLFSAVMSARPPCVASAILALLVFAPSAASAQALGGGAAERYVLPAATPIDLIIEEAVSSDERMNGDRFPLRVAEDVLVDGVVVIPAGSPGEGEVVHAARSRRGGKAGELILAARYVTAGGLTIKLRSFAGGSGKDRTKASVGLAATLGFAGLLVRGGEYVIPAGTLANAKTVEDVELPSAARSGADAARDTDLSFVPPTEEP